MHFVFAVPIHRNCLCKCLKPPQKCDPTTLDSSAAKRPHLQQHPAPPLSASPTAAPCVQPDPALVGAQAPAQPPSGPAAAAAATHPPPAGHHKRAASLPSTPPPCGNGQQAPQHHAMTTPRLGAAAGDPGSNSDSLKEAKRLADRNQVSAGPIF